MLAENCLKMIFFFWGWGRRNVEIVDLLGGIPGLVVMGGDSRSEGCEFESEHGTLDGHFSY